MACVPFGVDMQLQGFTIYSFVVVSDSFILFIMTTFWATCSSKVYNLQCSFVVVSDSFILFIMTTFWATCSSKVYNLQCSFVVVSDSFILFMMTSGGLHSCE